MKTKMTKINLCRRFEVRGASKNWTVVLGM